MTALINHNKKDFESWRKRALNTITNSEEIKELREKKKMELETGVSIQRETFLSDDEKEIEIKLQAFLDAKIREIMYEQEERYQLKMNQPGAVPMSAKYLNKSDNDGNQLWRLTCMKADIAEYMKVLKKNGYPCQEFKYNGQRYIDE